MSDEEPLYDEPSYSEEKPSYHELSFSYDKVQYEGEIYLARGIRIISVERYWGFIGDWVGGDNGLLEVQRHLKAGHGISLPEEVVNIRAVLEHVPGHRWEEIVAKHFRRPWRKLCLALLPEIDEGFPLYKLCTPEYLFEESSQETTELRASMNMYEYYYELANTIVRDLDNRTIRFTAFRSLFRKICTIVDVLEEGTTGEPFKTKVVNELSNILATDPDVLLDFLRSLFNSVVEALEQKRIISQCKLCGDYFIYVREKRHCSLKSERKDCAKKAANRRYYAKYAERIRDKQRKHMKEIRDRHKERGLKK